MSYIRYRKDEEEVGGLIRRLLAAYGLDTGLREVRLKEAWADVLGNLAPNYSLKPRIKGRIMFVSLKSAALRQELSMHKTKLIEEVNNRAGCPGFLQDIVMR
jgi:hypothetical protein